MHDKNYNKNEYKLEIFLAELRYKILYFYSKILFIYIHINMNNFDTLLHILYIYIQPTFNEINSIILYID